MARRGAAAQPGQLRRARAGALHAGRHSGLERPAGVGSGRLSAPITTLRAGAGHGDACRSDRRRVDGAGAHAPGGVRILLSLATAIVILAVALLILFTPIWTHFALGAAGSV